MKSLSAEYRFSSTESCFCFCRSTFLLCSIRQFQRRHLLRLFVSRHPDDLPKAPCNDTLLYRAEPEPQKATCHVPGIEGVWAGKHPLPRSISDVPLNGFPHLWNRRACSFQKHKGWIPHRRAATRTGNYFIINFPSRRLYPPIRSASRGTIKFSCRNRNDIIKVTLVTEEQRQADRQQLREGELQKAHPPPPPHTLLSEPPTS